MNNLERVAVVYILSVIGILAGVIIGNTIYKLRLSKRIKHDAVVSDPEHHIKNK